jgi:hypothetical protein
VGIFLTAGEPVSFSRRTQLHAVVIMIMIIIIIIRRRRRRIS